MQPKFYCQICKSQPLLPILSQIKPIQNLTTSILRSALYYIVPCAYFFHEVSFLQVISPELQYLHLLSPIRDICIAHPFSSDLIIFLPFCKDYESSSSLSCIFSSSLLASFLVGPNILLSKMFANTLIFIILLTLYRQNVSVLYKDSACTAQ